MGSEIQPWQDDAEFRKSDRAADIINMRRNGETFVDIANALNLSLGYVRRIFYDELRQRPSAEVALLRQEMSDRFDAYRSIAFKILQARHYVIAPNGKVVRSIDHLDEDVPLADHKPILEALHLLMDVEKQEMRLWGLEAPKKLEVEGTVIQYEIIGVNPSEVLE